MPITGSDSFFFQSDVWPAEPKILFPNDRQMWASEQSSQQGTG